MTIFDSITRPQLAHTSRAMFRLAYRRARFYENHNNQFPGGFVSWQASEAADYCLNHRAIPAPIAGAVFLAANDRRIFDPMSTAAIFFGETKPKSAARALQIARGQ